MPTDMFFRVTIFLLVGAALLLISALVIAEPQDTRLHKVMFIHAIELIVLGTIFILSGG